MKNTLWLAILFLAQASQAQMIRGDSGTSMSVAISPDGVTTSSLTVNGTSQFNGDITVGSGVEVAGPLTASSITVNGTTQLNGNVTMGANTNIAGPLTASSITVNGVGRINGALTITSTTLNGTLTGPAIFSFGAFDPDVHTNTVQIGQLSTADTDGAGICITQNDAGETYCLKTNTAGRIYETKGNGSGANTQTVRRFMDHDGSYAWGGTSADSTPHYHYNASTLRGGINDTTSSGELGIKARAANTPTSFLLHISSQNESPLFTIDVNGVGVMAGTFTALGVVNASSATAGTVGEIATASLSGDFVPINNSIVSIATLTLTAGDWDITGVCAAQIGGTTVSTERLCAFSTTPNAAPDGLHANFHSGSPAVSTNENLVMPVRFYNTSATTTIYLTARLLAGTVGGFAWTTNSHIQARRVR